MSKTAELSSDEQTAFPLVWDSNAKTLKEILRTNTLPQVVKIGTEENIIQNNDEVVDLHKPFLVYRRLAIPKVFGHCVRITDRHESTINYTGPQLVIPHEYPGWFTIATKLDGPTTEPVLTVSKLAEVMPAMFISTKNMHGFVRDIKSTKAQYIKKNIRPSVMRVVSVVEDVLRYINSRGTLRKRAKICLSCVSEEGEEVLLPFKEQGTFYLPASVKSKLRQGKHDPRLLAYSIRDLVDLSQFPVVVKLISGSMPEGSCDIGSYINLTEIKQEDSILGCTIHGANKLFELPSCIALTFERALNGSDISNNILVRNAMEIASRSADNYIKTVKVRRDYSTKKKDISENGDWYFGLNGV